MHIEPKDEKEEPGQDGEGQDGEGQNGEGQDGEGQDSEDDGGAAVTKKPAKGKTAPKKKGAQFWERHNDNLKELDGFKMIYSFY